MKKLIQNIVLLTPLLLMLASCDQFLEKNPDNRVDLDTVEKAAKLLTNAYSSSAYTFTDWMGDNVTYTLGTFKLPEHVQAYQWEDITPDNQDTPTYFWTATYDAIAHANEVLAVIDNLPGEQSRKDAVRAEALLTRAYGHFMLVNLFARHYNRQTALNDPGIPYVEEPEREFIKKYNRHTVEEVYDKIERDLKEGLRLVDGRYYSNSGKYHFTRNAALAFASRFYLFRDDPDNCINYSSEMLGDDPDIFMKDLPTILDTYSDTEEFLRLFTSPDDPSNLLLIRNITNAHVTVGFWPDIDLIDNLYLQNPWSATDLRRSDRYPLFVRGTNGVAVGKYEFLFERSSLTSNVGLNYTIMPAFRGEEVLLNRAEANVYLGNYSTALADLQVYINKRYEEKPIVSLSSLRNYYQTTNNEIAVLSFIVDERRKEFIHEGIRWFDIKRFGFPVDHLTESGNVITLEGNDLRQVLQIPQAAIDVGGLEPNPR
ncbi:MAG: RagB/SusD family nutrient uptake outer membrane protein [Flammeovirgaceae bacterium]|nr:RagB/SusD family nutrient uptake outer membrane protein [Flammeovirgaceae bacterium]